MEFKFNRQIKESIDSIMKQIPIRQAGIQNMLILLEL